MFFVLTVQYTCPNYFLLTQTTEPRQKFATNNVMSFFKKKKHFCCEEGNIKKIITHELCQMTKITAKNLRSKIIFGCYAFQFRLRCTNVARRT